MTVTEPLQHGPEQRHPHTSLTRGDPGPKHGCLLVKLTSNVGTIGSAGWSQRRCSSLCVPCPGVVAAKPPPAGRRGPPPRGAPGQRSKQPRLLLHPRQPGHRAGYVDHIHLCVKQFASRNGTVHTHANHHANQPSSLHKLLYSRGSAQVDLADNYSATHRP